MASTLVSMQQLLEAGAHFGHQTHRWDPRMKPYIFGDRNGVHIIDLSQSVPLFARALDFVQGTVARGGKVLFVGTKRQAQDAVAEAAGRPFLVRPPVWLMKMAAGGDTLFMARSQRVSNRAFRDATGWAPTVHDAREGWRRIAEALRQPAAPQSTCSSCSRMPCSARKLSSAAMRSAAPEWSTTTKPPVATLS